MQDTWTMEDRAWQAAYAIAWVGASNPRGVTRSLTEYREALGPEHVAARAIAGHLAFLQGESIGPEFDELDAVLSNARRLGIHTH
jgi:hypothetical protein